MNWNSIRTETLTLEQVAAALSEDWRQKVKRHFRDRNIDREPSSLECVVMYYVTVKKRRKDDQLSLFE